MTETTQPRTEEERLPPVEMLRRIMLTVNEIHRYVYDINEEREQLKRERDALASTIHINQELMQKIFQVSKRTLQRWRNEKRVPYHITATGGYCYYLFDEVEVALKRGTISCKYAAQTEAIARLNMFKEGVVQGKTIEDMYGEFE